MEYTIRQLITKMSAIPTNALYLKECKTAVNLMYGRPNDRECEYSYSWWKTINGKPVCRYIHCYIPRELFTPEIMRHCIDKEYINNDEFKMLPFILPERKFNDWLSRYTVDYWNTITDAQFTRDTYEALMDDMMDW